MPPPGDAAEKFNMNAQLLYFWYATATKVRKIGREMCCIFYPRSRPAPKVSVSEKKRPILFFVISW